jgi:serine/threonine-protein kinase
MASVHIGRFVNNLGFARTVAIKRLYPQFVRDPEFVAMFVDEARLAARIKHPNVVPTLDIVREGDQLLLVMEYVPGEVLSRLLLAASTRSEALDPRIACALVVGILQGLHAAHEAKNEFGEPLGILHRDVSPQNVLVGVDGVARVLGLGIAKAKWQACETRGGEVKAKSAYMAPEQLRGGPVTRAADVWASSVVLWEALAGEPLFKGENDAEIIRRVLSDEIPEPSREGRMPSDLFAVLRRGLCRNPGQRFPTARAMATAIEQAISLPLPSEVGEWVERMSGEAIARRAEQVHEMESSARTPRGTELVPSAEFIADALSWNTSKSAARGTLQPGRTQVDTSLGTTNRPARSSRPLDASEVAEVALSKARLPPPPPRRTFARWVRVGGAVAMALLLLALGSVLVPSYAERAAIRSAALRGVSLEIEDASGGYFAVHFHGVKGVVPEVAGVRIAIADVDVDLAWMRPQRAIARGVALSLDGPVAKTLDLLRLWSRGHEAEGVRESLLDGLRVEIPAARVNWTRAFLQDGRIAADEVSGDMTLMGSARQGHELHFSTSKLTFTSATATIGPWRLDLEGAPDATTLRVAFDPPVPDGPSAIVTGMSTGKAQFDLNIPRSPLYRLGVPPVALASLSRIPEQVEIRLHFVRGTDDHVDSTLTAAFFGVKDAPTAAPVDLHVSGSISGPGSAPLELQGGALTMGPVRASLTGPVSLRPDGVSAKLAWKTAPIPCSQLLPRGPRASRDWTKQLASLDAERLDLIALGLDVATWAQAAGWARVEGNFLASGTFAFDSSDPTHPTFTAMATNSCGVTLFGPR